MLQIIYEKLEFKAARENSQNKNVYTTYKFSTNFYVTDVQFVVEYFTG